MFCSFDHLSASKPQNSKVPECLKTQNLILLCKCWHVFYDHKHSKLCDFVTFKYNAVMVMVIVDGVVLIGTRKLSSLDIPSMRLI